MPEAAVKAQNYLKNGDPWQMHGLGIILLSGLERSVMRLKQPESMKQFCHRITTSHLGMNVKSNEMAKCLLISQPVIIEAVKKYWSGHQSFPNDDDQTCLACEAWAKMFQYTAIMLRTGGKALDLPINRHILHNINYTHCSLNNSKPDQPCIVVTET